MKPGWCNSNGAGRIRLAIHVIPNAKKSEIVGILDEALKIRLHAPAQEGRANEALIQFLAKTLNLPKSAIVITHGQTNKRKLLELTANGLTVQQIQQCLLKNHPPLGEI